MVLGLWQLSIIHRAEMPVTADLDVSPEAVERLAKRHALHVSSKYPTAATLRALSAENARLRAERDAAWQAGAEAMRERAAAAFGHDMTGKLLASSILALPLPLPKETLMPNETPTSTFPLWPEGTPCPEEYLTILHRIRKEHPAARPREIAYRAAREISDEDIRSYSPLVLRFEELLTPESAQPDSVASGRKDDQDKTPYHLLPPEFLELPAQVLAFGAKKYSARNWERGMNWSRPFSALMRHMWAWWRGENLDPETNLPHLAHAACCIMFLLSYESRAIGTDDRPEPLE